MRDWWIRTLLVLQAPRPVFTALRDDTPKANADRAEPVLLIVILAGIAAVLSTATAGRLMDDPNYDAILVPVWAFVAGGMYGAVAYWGLGALLHGAVRALGSQGSYRRTRHVLAFAAVPLALSLAVWPVKLAVFGADVFHRGGSDAGGAAVAFVGVQLAFALWAAELLVVGVRAVHGWTWARAAAAVAAAVVVPLALALGAGSLV